MSALVTGWLGSTASGLIAELFGHLLSTKSDRVKEVRECRKAAASELVAPMREFQSLLRRYGNEDVARDEIETACKDWAVALDAVRHRLPREWRHVPRNVQEAVGTVFGGVAFIHADPGTKKMTLGEPDVMWQEFADCYLEDVAARLLKWGDSISDVGIVEEHYDSWLARTGRREPYGTIAVSSSVRSPSSSGRQRVHASRARRVDRSAVSLGALVSGSDRAEAE